MSINWVMLDSGQRFVRLADEKLIYTSPARTGLGLESGKGYPGTSPVSYHSNTGTVYLTNRRVVYLPATSTPKFQSFSCPLNHLHDTRVTAPLFGPNVFQALVQPVQGGGLPPNQTQIVLSLTFRDGGAYDYHSNFERIRERLLQAIENATQNSDRGSSARPQEVDLSAVHLDTLPTYENSGRDALAPQPSPPAPSRPVADWHEDPVPAFEEVVEGRVPQQRPSAPPPSEAPPGYEETQQQSIQLEIESRLSKGA